MQQRTQYRSNSIDCPSNYHDDTSNGSTSSFGLKLILKRQAGDKYEIKTSTGAPSSPASNYSNDSTCHLDRPKRQAARKVKFHFSETESDESPIKKRPRLSNLNTQPRCKIIEYKEILLPFDKTELVAKCDLNFLEHIKQPKVSLNHSIPFPIALVEDKTNIVHTKALLLIHLYQSYSSPCIICVLCKNFFSIGEFSKHFHISEEDLDEDDDEDEEPESENEHFGSYLDIIERKKQKKLFNLKKKSYKILPYCLNQNNELNEDQLKIWKLFSEKFTQYKLKRQNALQAKEKQKEINKAKKKLKPKSKINNGELMNWDYLTDSDDLNEKRYYLNEERLDNEKIVYLDKNGSSLTDNEEEKPKKIEIERVVRKARIEEPDLSLSEDESDQEEKEKRPKMNLREIRRNLMQSNCKPKYSSQATPLQKHFTYYESLGAQKLTDLKENSILIMPQSLILYNLKKRFLEYKNIQLAETDYYKSKWYCLALDLDVKRKA